MWWIILGIIGYILLWGLTSSLLYKFFNILRIKKSMLPLAAWMN